MVRVDCVREEIRFAVADTGIGIASGLLTQVFTRNVQLAANDRRGAGLGLYISRSLVKRHGGRIWAESTPAEGTTFFFTVPLARNRFRLLKGTVKVWRRAIALSIRPGAGCTADESRSEFRRPSARRRA